MDERRIIYISRLVSDGELRSVLLHEMVHVAIQTRGRHAHGRRFQRDLGRLASLGEAWAEEGRQIYAQPVIGPRRTVQDDMATLLMWPDISTLTWGAARKHLARQVCMAPNAFSVRFPWAKAKWHRLYQEELESRRLEVQLWGEEKP